MSLQCKSLKIAAIKTTLGKKLNQKGNSKYTQNKKTPKKQQSQTTALFTLYHFSLCYHCQKEEIGATWTRQRQSAYLDINQPSPEQQSHDTLNINSSKD